MKALQDNISNNLRELRKSKKLTQSEFAEILNYSDKTVSKWETGEATPNIDVLKQIADYYCITLDDLILPPEELSKKVSSNSTNNDMTLRNRRRFVITMLAITAVWIMAVLIFIYSSLISISKPWIVFIYAIPMTAIVGIVFNSLWGKSIHNYYLISVLVWTILLVFYLEFIENNVWLIFILGIPIQIAIILWSQLKIRSKKQKPTKNEDSENKQNENKENKENEKTPN